jgi:hypothetical protein
VALELRLGKRAERDDLGARCAGIHDRPFDQFDADAHTAQFIGHAGMIDDDQRVAGARVGEFRIGFAFDVGRVRALRPLLVMRDGQVGVGFSMLCVPKGLRNPPTGFAARCRVGERQSTEDRS